MKKPIFRVFVSYEIRNKKRITRSVVKGTLDTFAFTSSIKEIKEDEEFINRICYVNKKKPENVNIIITDVEIENQYGETSDRF